MAAKIQQRSELVNRQCFDLQKRLSADGLRSCILKGQGVALLYDSLSALRQSGDIDLWVIGDYQQTKDYLKKEGVDGKITANHAEAHFFSDTEVEVHPIPAIFRNPITNKKWKRFVNEHIADWQVANGMTVPSVDFNLVFLMVHMYQHLLREGIGLRQMMDYYFVLRQFHDKKAFGEKTVLTKTEKNIVGQIESLSMKRFASGVMDIMHNVFGVPEEELLCEPDPEAGAELLEEIMTGGNFGHYDERNAVAFDNNSNPLQRVWRSQKRNMRFLKYGFWKIACSPLWRLWHFCWMKKNGYR